MKNERNKKTEEMMGTVSKKIKNVETNTMKYNKNCYS